MESKAFDLFYNGNFDEAKRLFETLLKNVKDKETRNRCLFNIASCDASLGDLEKANESFGDFDSNGNDLVYNKALCAYKLGRYDESLKLANLILANCDASYPELVVRHNETNLDDEKIGMILQDSHIVEAQNLKSAAMLQLGQDLSSVKQCLAVLPIKREDLLDCITLHNKAIYEHESDMQATISKVDYLSKFWMDAKDQPELAVHLPRETFRNLMILYFLRDNPDFSEPLEFVQTNRDQIEQNINSAELEFFDIYFNSNSLSSSDELVYRKLDRLLGKLSDEYISLDTSEKRNHLSDLIMVVLTHEGLILWYNDQYTALEKLLSRFGKGVGKELEENLIYQTNLAHTLFMTDVAFEECVRLYKDLVKKLANEGQTLVSMDPQILSCLCVAYVLTGRNNDAEALIKDLESREVAGETRPILSTLSLASPQTNLTDILKLSPLCYINLVIGTLYCAKYNYDFGLTRIFKSLKPLDLKLNFKTWFFAKRCILSLLDRHCKQMICAKDDLFNQIISFLIQCEKFGTDISALDPQFMLFDLNDVQKSKEPFQGRITVAYEASYLRSVVLTIVHD